MSFFAELKRRNVFRVAASYVVVGWLIVQVVSALSGPLNLPEWFETVVVVLLGIDLPIALLFAWAFDLTPDGIRRTETAGAAAIEARELTPGGLQTIKANVYGDPVLEQPEWVALHERIHALD